MHAGGFRADPHCSTGFLDLTKRMQRCQSDITFARFPRYCMPEPPRKPAGIPASFEPGKLNNYGLDHAAPRPDSCSMSERTDTFQQFASRRPLPRDQILMSLMKGEPPKYKQCVLPPAGFGHPSQLGNKGFSGFQCLPPMV